MTLSNWDLALLDFASRSATARCTQGGLENTSEKMWKQKSKKRNQNPTRCSLCIDVQLLVDSVDQLLALEVPCDVLHHGPRARVSIVAFIVIVAGVGDDVQALMGVGLKEPLKTLVWFW
jgi:hypothetical protein